MAEGMVCAQVAENSCMKAILQLVGFLDQAAPYNSQLHTSVSHAVADYLSVAQKDLLAVTMTEERGFLIPEDIVAWLLEL